MKKTVSFVDADGYIVAEHTYDDADPLDSTFEHAFGKLVPRARPANTDVVDCRWTGSTWDVGPHIRMERLKMRVQQRLVDKCRQALAVGQTIDPDTAALKYSSAVEYLADDKAPALVLRAEAARTGEKLKTLAEKIVKNFERSQKRTGAIEGIRRSIPDQVSKIKTQEQAQTLLDAIDKELAAL